MGSYERLRALASDTIEWPQGEGVSVNPDVMGGDPCFAGHRIAIHHFASDWESNEEVDARILYDYPLLTAEKLALGRAYWERHTDLFEADSWRSYMDNDAFPSPEGEQRETLQGDIRALLAENERLRSALEYYAQPAWEQVDDDEGPFYVVRNWDDSKALKALGLTVAQAEAGRWQKEE